MPAKIEIIGNFLKISEIPSRRQFVGVPIADATYNRDQNDNFVFINRGQVINNYGSGSLNRLGRIESMDYLDIEPNQTYIYPASQIADSNGILIGGPGAQWVDADEFEDWLSMNIGGSTQTVILNGLTAVSTDATLTGDGTPGNPLSVVPLIDKYEERFDPFLGIVNGAWHTIGGFPPNRIISIICEATQNSKNMGVRRTGSIINRQVELNAQSTASFTVETDMAGQIEVFTTNPASTNFYVESYLF